MTIYQNKYNANFIFCLPHNPNPNPINVLK